MASLLGDQPALPPLDRWDPPLSGEMDLVIRGNGEWWHEGSPIKRRELVRLFASILRREDDGEYYLVTPVEKWRVSVEDQPLLIVDFDIRDANTDAQRVWVTSNVDRTYCLGETYPLFVEHGPARAEGEGADTDPVPLVALDNHLRARFTRAAWYRLVESGRRNGDTLDILSDGHRFTLGRL